jgi:hypothetical protein
MMRRYATGCMLALVVGGLVCSGGSLALAQMGPGMMGGGQASAMPMPQMAEVIKQMADRLASGQEFDATKAEQLRRLADQLAEATGRMAGGMGGGMMGRGPERMQEVSRILSQMSDLLRAP